jgi:tetratricopeptide (TPR) repeat protein
MTKSAAFATGVFVAVLACAAPLARAAGDDSYPAAVREASKHFQRGVTLYSEADYHGALVEFQRAYALMPNLIVLYNVGETQYQLRDYGGALQTFERYLSEAGPSDPHRAQVESNVKVLRSRVGQLTIVTVPLGAEVTVDDRPIGKTPFDRPITVGVGHLKVSAASPGRPAVTRYVDVAADDSVSMTLDLSPPVAAKVAALPPATGPDEVPRSRSYGRQWRTAGWIATGALAAGAIGFGVLAYRESKDLEDARDRYPTTASTLTQKANRTRTLSIVADSLTAAVLVVGGVTLYSTLTAGKEETSTRVMVGLGGLYLDGTF